MPSSDTAGIPPGFIRLPSGLLVPAPALVLAASNIDLAKKILDSRAPTALERG